MSNIDSPVVDPARKPPLPPDGIVPDVDPGEDHVGSDEVRDPEDDDLHPIEPDPEEGGRPVPGDIERAARDRPPS